MVKLHVFAQLAIITACYVVPYAMLAKARDISLAMFWGISSIASIALSILKLYRGSAPNELAKS